MSGGICFLSLVAVRSAPSDTAEMVNQLLFGDLVDIAGSQGSWLHVVSRHDGYEGWCDFKQITLLDEELPEQL
ncbi:MAG TPA: SH3 domain-containing protein, partial [Lentimicrobium sp.]|nr:SH3 domain-containing protein [Lentimicrobium sp.]